MTKLENADKLENNKYANKNIKITNNLWLILFLLILWTWKLKRDSNSKLIKLFLVSANPSTAI